MVNNTSSSGIILFAKQSGLTSFSSLGAIKKALHTNKVGHTGTLDSFAEGLMVVLTGSLTRLAPYFTCADKKYLAVVKFGSETDTLEVSGKVIKTGPVPTKDQISPHIMEDFFLHTGKFRSWIFMMNCKELNNLDETAVFPDSDPDSTHRLPAGMCRGGG